MFRENVLTKDRIIDRITATMVPVAVDRWKADDLTTPEGSFLGPFLKAHPATGSPCIYSPEGELLGAIQGYHDMADRTHQFIDDALRAFGSVTPRNVEPVETHPHRGKGLMPDGSVSLALYIRSSVESARFLNTKTPVISSMTLSGKEFSALAPPRSVPGSKWELPEAVAKKFSRITSPLCYQHAPQPAWVTTALLEGEVRSIKRGLALIDYKGHLASEHETAGRSISVQETKVAGEGVYDLENNRMVSVLWLGSGRLRWPEAPEKIVPFDSLVEWSLTEESVP